MHPLHEIEFTKRTGPLLPQPAFQTRYTSSTSGSSTLMKDMLAGQQTDRIRLVVLLHVVLARADAARSVRFIARVDHYLAEWFVFELLSIQRVTLSQPAAPIRAFRSIARPKRRPAAAPSEAALRS